MSEAMNEAVPGEDEDFTPLQEAYLHKVMANYQANLWFFRDKFPHIFEKLMAVPLPAPFEVDREGKTTIYHGRHKGSHGDFTKLGQLLYEYFDDPERRPHISVVRDYFETPELAFPHATNPDFYRPVEPKYRGELINGFLSRVASGAAKAGQPNFGRRRLPIAVVFGSGYGWHLNRLVDDWEIRHLIIVDTDIARLNLSLYFVDYPALYQRFSEKGFYFSFAYDEDMEALAANLMGLIYSCWPPYFIQGAGLFFNDYDTDNVKELWENIRKGLWALYRGWGFLDDEILGLKHAVENARSGYPVFAGRADIPAKAAAIVVGAGPSLDPMIPLLRANADRAMIISCGSAITALARAGIKPDLHVEVERTYMTYEVLDEPVTREWVKDVPIAALSIMHPAVFTATNRPVMFLKQLDLGTAIADFFNEMPRLRSGPTCTNGGLALALAAGFKWVGLVGVDFGFRDSEYHHAKTSMYFDEDTEQSEVIKRIVRDTHSSHREGREVPGNFGGEVLSTEIFMHSRDSMVLTIRENPDAQVFNLNDGAEIKGAQPLRPEALDLGAERAEVKGQALEAFFSAFQPQGEPQSLRKLDQLSEQLQAVREDFKRILGGEIAGKLEAGDKLFDLHHYLFDDRHQAAQIFPLLRGSMLHMGRFLLDCIAMFEEDADGADFARFGFELYDRFLEEGIERIQSLKKFAVGGEAAS